VARGLEGEGTRKREGDGEGGRGCVEFVGRGEEEAGERGEREGEREEGEGEEGEGEGDGGLINAGGKDDLEKLSFLSLNLESAEFREKSGEEEKERDFIDGERGGREKEKGELERGSLEICPPTSSEFFCDCISRRKCHGHP
jgi:hypothetical protein